jgi:hypothetical protein
VLVDTQNEELSAGVSPLAPFSVASLDVMLVAGLVVVCGVSAYATEATPATNGRRMSADAANIDNAALLVCKGVFFIDCLV